MEVPTISLHKSGELETKPSSKKLITEKVKKSPLHTTFAQDKVQDPFVKFSDLVFFYSDDNQQYLYGEGVKFRCIGHAADEEITAHFSSAVFRLQPKYEYAAQKELFRFSDTESVDDGGKNLKRLEERAEAERSQNELEERALAGKPVFFGQILQLVHFATNMYLEGDKRNRADLEPNCLRVSLQKEGSKNTWFKIMPRFKVRFEGEQVRRGDQIVLIHVKSGQFMHLSENPFDTGNNEVNLFNSQTGWNIFHYAPFVPKSEKYLQGGDVVRIFHQEAEGFIKANMTPLYDRKEYQVFVKSRGKKSANRVDSTKSSNTLFQVEMRTVMGGLIPWNSECRFKHLGTGKYLAIHKDNTGKKHLILTRDFRSQNTIFVLFPVDKEEDHVGFGSFFRIQHTEDTERNWLHISGFIQDPTQMEREKDTSNEEVIFVFTRDKYQEIVMEENFHYQDVMFFKSVPREEIDELHYVSTLHDILHEFLKKVKPHHNKLNESNPTLLSHSKEKKSGPIVIFEIDTSPVIAALGKMISFSNDSTEADPLEQNGLPISSHQTLLFEQQTIEICIDILYHSFGFNPKKWKEDPEATKVLFEAELVKEGNKHIQKMLCYIYKLFENMIRGNKKIGLFISRYLNLFLLHMGGGLGVRKTLVVLFSDNSDLLNNLPVKYIDTFVALLLQSNKSSSYKLLEFLAAICTCNNEPVFSNQNAVLDQIAKYGEKLIIPTHYDHATKKVTVKVNNKWIHLEDFVKIEPPSEENKEEVKKKKKSLASTYNSTYRGEISYLKVQLDLCAKAAVANTRGIELLSKLPFPGYDQPLISADEVFVCLQNEHLPGSFRAAYCQLLCLWIDADFSVEPTVGIKYTWAWSELTENYVSGSRTLHASKEEQSHEDTWLFKNKNDLKAFVISFLQQNQTIEVTNEETTSLLLSVLLLLKKLVKYGFFKKPKTLLPLLIRLLSKESDKIDKSTFKFSSYDINEYTINRAKSRLEILDVLHLFYNIRLEDRTAKQLFVFKCQQIEQTSKEEKPKEEHKHHGLTDALLHHDHLHLHHPQETEIELVTIKDKDSDFRDPTDNEFVSILLNLTLYNYEPLAKSALNLLFRHMRPTTELVHTLHKVQLLTNDVAVRVYHTITDGISKMRELLKDNDISDDDGPQIEEIMRKFIDLCCYKGDLNKGNPQNQTIFRNLEVHEDVINILRLPYRLDYKPVFKLCYIFIKQFCIHNKINQAIMFPHIEFFMSQMGYQLNIADTITEILSSNYNLCQKVEEAFIAHMVKLLRNKGRKRKYLLLLSAIVEADGKVIPQNQSAVINGLMSHRDEILYFARQLNKKTLSVETASQESKSSKKKKTLTDSEKDSEARYGPGFTQEAINRATSTVAINAPGKLQKLDLATYEEMERNKKRNNDDEDLMYHVTLINLLARCCVGYNHVPEAMCQSIISYDECLNIIRDPTAGPLLKAAYCNFISEVYFFTARNLSIHIEEKSWDLIEYLLQELKGYNKKRSDSFTENFIFEGILGALKAFFSHEFEARELTTERIKVANHVFDILFELAASIKKDYIKLSRVVNCIDSIMESKIEGFDRKDHAAQMQATLAKVKERLGTLGQHTLKELQRVAIEEKQKLIALKAFTAKLEKRTKSDGVFYTASEFETVVEVFKGRMLAPENKSKEKENREKHILKNPKGTRFTEKLITQLKHAEADPLLATDCLKLLIAMVFPSAHHSHDSFLAHLVSGDDEEKADDETKTEIQNKLGDLGAMRLAIDLLQDSDPHVVVQALKLSCTLLSGGNKQIQQSMLTYFLESSDPHFFDDIRNRIVVAASELKSRRKDQSLQERRKMMDDPEEEEEEEEEEEMSSSGIANQGHLDLILLLLQNLCEGQFLEMKNYLRDQHNNTKSFNLVRETALFAAELERSIEDNLTLGIQLFRSLTEFAAGCEGNQLAIVEAKVFVSFNNILSRLPQCSSASIIQLKQSMVDLMNSLVEGSFPQRHDPETGDIPPTLLRSIDYLLLDTTMENAVLFKSEIIPMDTQLKMKEKDPKYHFRASEQGEADLALALISKCIILMKVLNEYDAKHETKSNEILTKDIWTEFASKNVGSIEIVNGENDLERVYFQIPEMCHNLSDSSKQEVLRTVKRDSPVDRVEDFVIKSDLLKFEILHQTSIAKSKFSWLSRFSEVWRNIVLFLSVVINALMLGFYQDSPQGGEGPFMITPVAITVQVLAVVHSFFCALWLAVFLWTRGPIIIEKGRQGLQEDLKQQNLVRKKEGKEPLQLKFTLFHRMYYLGSSGTLLYRVVYLVLAVIGIAYPGTFCFHLLDFSAQSPQVRSVMAAVTVNGKSILLTALLGIILIYIYAMIAFFYFGIFYNNPGLDCATLFSCTVTTINYGIRSGGGIGDALDSPDYLDGGIFWSRLVFDITFWILIVIIILNVVFGIILDTFGELRDEKTAIEEDIKNICFVCGISSNTFQQKALGHKHHLKKDHKLWNYLYFFVYLDVKNKDDYTAAEDYVFEKNNNNDVNYFPIEKAICLLKPKKKKKNKKKVDDE